MRSAIPLIISCLTLSGCHTAKQSKTQSAAQDTTTSTVTISHEDNYAFPTVDNGRFYAIPEYRLEGEKTADLLLEEHIVTQVRNDRECCEASITVKGTIDGKPAWALQKNGAFGEMFDRFYRTVTPGCCASSTRYAYFDPLTGHRAFIASQPITEIEMVGGDTRYLVLNRISEPGDDGFDLQIQYGPQSGPSQIAYLVASGQELAPSQTRIQLLSEGKLSTLPSADESGYATRLDLFPAGYPKNRAVSVRDYSFEIVLTVEGQPTIHIPVRNDRMELAHVALPHGFRFTPDMLPADVEYYKNMQK